MTAYAVPLPDGAHIACGRCCLPATHELDDGDDVTPYCAGCVQGAIDEAASR